jgi:hypothetical protein
MRTEPSPWGTARIGNAPDKTVRLHPITQFALG